jgi:serine/threonine-protein kinase HipA
MWPTSKSGRLDRLVVFITLDGPPVPVGELVFEGREHSQSFFRYAGSWLENRADRFALSPALPLRARAAISAPFALPLPFYDAAPDGWGKSVLTQAYPQQIWGMGEFLAAAGEDRTGELSFGPDPRGLPEQFVPPHASMIQMTHEESSLEDLLEAAEAVDEGRPRAHHLQLLFRTSADVGGARPKTRIHMDGKSWIAKFPAIGDVFDDPRMEAACLDLAAACGIETPDHDVVQVLGRSVLLVERFDRGQNGERHGYMSAATLAGQPPSEYHTNVTYAELAAMAREAGIQPCERDLFRRLLLNCFLHNTDDHLRNHAFLRRGGQWALSPVYDLVPSTHGRLVMAPADGALPVPDPMIAMNAHAMFRLDWASAVEIYDEVVTGLSEIEQVLDAREISAKDCDTVRAMMPFAFNPPRLRTVST